MEERRVKVLVLENAESDYLLMLRNLRQQGLDGEFLRIDTFPGLVQAVAAGGWDVVITDYNMPGLDFRTALAFLQGELPDVPVVLVSGSIGEETAIGLLREGIWDFVSKDHPGRLAQALTHSMAEARTRRAMAASAHALHASEARYRTLFQNMLSGYAHCRMVFEADRPVDFIYLDVNDAFERLTGLREVVGRRVSEVIPQVQSTNQELFECYGRVARTGVPEYLETFVPGLGIWFALSVYRPVQGEFVAVFENVTQRKRDEAELRETSDRLRQATLAGRFGVWDWDLLTDSVYYDDRMQDIYGLRPGESPGGLGWWKARIHPDDLDGAVRTIVGTIVAGEDFSLEFRVLRPGGELRYVKAFASVLRDESGRALRIVGLQEDITARRTAEEARLESEAMFLALSDNAGDAIIVNDHYGAIREVNRRACVSLGYTREELLGLNLTDFVPGLELTEVQKLWGSLQPHEPFTLTSRLRRKDGGEFPVEVSLTPFRLGERDLLLAIVHDITGRLQEEEERRLLETELRHAEKLESLGSLASGVAHDMNNVLAAILAVAQVLRLSRGGDDPGLTEALDTILRAGNRGRDLVKGLTNFARKDLRSAEPVDLNRVVREEADLLSHTLRQKIALQVELEPGLPWVLGEPGNIGSALMNLCVNAVDAMEGGGTLTLRTRRLEGDLVELQVEDTGEGMPPEVLARALEPFYTTKPMGKGTGLGLAMVCRTVKAHHGQVDIQSEPQRGTRVRLRLPACEPEGAGEPAQDEDGPEPAAPSGVVSVLVVDDDELVQGSLTIILEQLGHGVTLAASGEEALDRLGQGLRPDVVILDMNMPGLGGAGTLPRLRALWPGLPVLLSTGRVDQAAIALAEAHPHVQLLPKPFNVKEFKRTLKAAQGGG